MIHATTVRYDQLQRMKQLNMIPTYFAEFFPNKVLGKTRTEKISPTRWTKELDLKFIMNHDCPVYQPNSILTLHHSVNRLTPESKIH